MINIFYKNTIASSHKRAYLFHVFFIGFCLLSASLVLNAAELQKMPIVYVASPVKGDANDNPGTKDKPVATINQGISKLPKSGGELRVAKGVYDGPIILPSGVHIVGGYDTGFKEERPTSISRSQLLSKDLTPDKYTGATVLINTHGDRVVSVDKLTAKTSINNVIVLGPDVSQQLGQSSYGIVVNDSDKGLFSLNTVKIIGGKAGMGKSGAPGKPASGYCTDSVPGGTANTLEPQYEVECNYMGTYGGCAKVYQTTDKCESHSGQDGISITNSQGETVAKGGSKGEPGKSYCHINNRVEKIAESEKQGKNGTKATQSNYNGQGGAPVADRVGRFKFVDGQLHWGNDTMGNTGIKGYPGAGGGSGGAGGSRQVNWAVCKSGALLGTTGGRGGKGGCPGNGGKGGYAGGGIFNLVLANSSIKSYDLSLLKTPGADGGKGGDGSKGSPGEAGQPANQTRQTSNCGIYGSRSAGIGGHGGAGAAGTTGGGGAGGNGGPSIAIARVGNAGIPEPRGLYEIIGSEAAKGGVGGLSAGKVSGEPGHGGLNEGEYDFRLVK